MSTFEYEYRERIQTLRDLDIDAFVAALPQDERQRFLNNPPHLQNTIALGAMHKARYEQLEFSEAEREESRQWLESHNMVRLKGRPFPPRPPRH